MTQLAVGSAGSGAAQVSPRRSLWQSRASGGLLLVLLLCLWEASARFGIVRSLNWPPFTAVLASLYAGAVAGDIAPAIGSTLWRMARGYVIGCACGVSVGFAIALFRPARLLLLPTIDLLRPIPIPAIIPPLIFLLGLDDRLRLFSIAFATFFPVTLNTLAGVQSVEPIYAQVARTFGVSRWTEIRRVVFPAALPFILAGLRTSLGLAFIVTIIAEMIVGQEGVGYYLVSMQFAMRAADMYGAILLITGIAYALNRGFVAGEARLIRWARQVETMRGESR